MNNMSVLEKNKTLNSREVAEMIEKRHSDLLRDIETYIGYINQNAKLRSDDFFSESTYRAGTGKEYKCYEISKMGCEMIANKLTGAKGVQFTALFVQKFNLLEENEMQRAAFYIPGTYAEALALAAKQAEVNEQLMIENEVKTQTIAEYEPKVSYYDQILRSTGLITVTQIAADYDLSAHKLNQILHQEHVQHKVSGRWILYKKYMNKGFTKSETVSIQHRNGRTGTKINTKWTQKGRLFIHEILEKIGIQAVIDKDI